MNVFKLCVVKMQECINQILDHVNTTKMQAGSGNKSTFSWVEQIPTKTCTNL